eukprot:3529942-Amphidinium_carterae.2
MRQRRNVEQTSNGCASIVTRFPRCRSGQPVAGRSRIACEPCEELKLAGWSKTRQRDTEQSHVSSDENAADHLEAEYDIDDVRLSERKGHNIHHYDENWRSKLHDRAPTMLAAMRAITTDDSHYMLRIVCVCKKWQVSLLVAQSFLEQLLGAVWQWPCEVT